MYLPLVVISTPALIFSIINAQNPLAPNAPLNLIYLFLVAPLVSGTGIFLTYRYLTTQTVDLAGAASKAFAKGLFLIDTLLISSIIVVLSSFALIIPGIFVGVKLGFGLYGVVLDDLRPIASLKQSWHLVAGRWWPTFGAMLLPTILILPIIFLATILGVLLGGSKATVLSSIISSSLTLVITPFLTTYYTKVYLRLKELAE